MAIKDIKEKAIALPFKIDTYGNIGYTVSQEKIWADRVKSAINTGLTERVNNLGFGTKISSEIFNTQSVAEETVRSEIQNVFSTYFKLLTLKSIETSFNEITNEITVEVSYTIPDGRDNTLQIGTAVIIDGYLSSEER